MSIDYLIRGGTVIDGSSGDASFQKVDLAIEGECIKDMGKLNHVSAERTLSVDGLIVCPGFIDVHAHSEFSLLADGRGEGKIAQGITTEINGNCGLSAAPLYGPALEQREGELYELGIKERWNTFSEYFALLEGRGIAANFATLAGHGNIRASVAGYEDRPLSPSELLQMRTFLRNAMDEGALGLSTGLIYPPGVYAETSEIVDLAGEVAGRKGIYATHMRSEGDRLIESVEEAITIAAQSGVHAHISHLKASGKKNWGKMGTVFRLIEKAGKRGLSVTCDRYPYIASSTDLDTVLPPWAFEGGRKREIQRLRNDREILAEHMQKDYEGPSDWEKVFVSSVITGKNKWMEGKNIAEISRTQNKTEPDTVFDVLIDEDVQVGAIFFTMNEHNLRSVLSQPYTVAGTDSAARSFSGITASGMPHPRGFGSCPRILGKYVRQLGLLSLPEAVRMMTGLPADIFGIERRGVLKRGHFADITIFDADAIIDRADFSAPFQQPQGIHHVFVNGIPVLYEGVLTGSLPGRIVRRSS